MKQQREMTRTIERMDHGAERREIVERRCLHLCAFSSFYPFDENDKLLLGCETKSSWQRRKKEISEKEKEGNEGPD